MRYMLVLVAMVVLVSGCCSKKPCHMGDKKPCAMGEMKKPCEAGCTKPCCAAKK
jgi:hypothetical protein